MIRPPSIRCFGACLAIFFAFCSDVPAAIFTVGSGPGCTHGTIQSALNAASASPGADTVRLTRSLTYEPELNTINDGENLNLVGGFATCTQTATDSIKTVVSGAGGAAGSVLRVFAGTGVVVKLRHLQISGGDAGALAGGGIYFQGDGVLEIIESTITNNSAASGGGIYAVATGSNAELVISESTLITQNTAFRNGGGISIAGPLEMTMTAPSSLIAFNQALGELGGTGYGGGLQVSGPAIAYIGTSGFGGIGAIYSNRAVDGGGISIISGSSDGADALVYLFTTNPTQPPGIIGNYATNRGGAVYLQGYEGAFDESTGRLCAWDFRIDGNAAREGSALYLNADPFLAVGGGSNVKLNYADCARPGAVRCASGTACNTISGNDAVETDGQPSDGATITVPEWSLFEARRFEMRGNRGRDAIRARGLFAIADCLLANNELSRQLLRTESDSFARVADCTIARNIINSSDVMQISYNLTLLNSIIDQPGNLSLAYSGSAGALDVSNVLASDITTLPDRPDIISGDPSFVDAANGNFRLTKNSLAVDFAPPVVGDDRDLDNQPRDQNLTCVPDLFGVRDLGAYELQVGAANCDAPVDIFRNGFESP